jgi:hypothetical protein
MRGKCGSRLLLGEGEEEGVYFFGCSDATQIEDGIREWERICTKLLMSVEGHGKGRLAGGGVAGRDFGWRRPRRRKRVNEGGRKEGKREGRKVARIDFGW